MSALRCSPALGTWVLASQLLACNAEILSECIGGDLTCSSSTEGETDCSCDGYELRCERERSKDYVYKWRSTGQTCGPPATATPDTPSDDELSSIMSTPVAAPTVDPEAVMNLDAALAPAFVRRAHTLQEVTGYLSVVRGLAERLDLPPTRPLSPLIYERPCQNTSTISGSECSVGEWTVNYTFHEFPASTTISLEARQLHQSLSLNLSTNLDSTQRQYDGYIHDAEESGYNYEFVVTCPGQGIRVSLTWGTLQVTNERIACPID